LYDPLRKVLRGTVRNERIFMDGGRLTVTGTCENVDFSGSRFDFGAGGAEFVGCNFEDVRFEAHNFGASNEVATLFRGCSFDRASMPGVMPGENARWETCTFRGTRISRWQPFHMEFVDCVFSGRLRSVSFVGRPYDVAVNHDFVLSIYEKMKARNPNGPPFSELKRKRNEFRGNDFRDADLVRVNFTHGIDIDAQLMPTGEQYVRLDRPKERIALARPIVEHWDDPALREQALGTLDMLSAHGWDEQKVIFMNWASAARPDVRERLRITYELLKSVIS
jgi:hypothetical protein